MATGGKIAAHFCVPDPLMPSPIDANRRFSIAPMLDGCDIKL
ncbi:hypothetical protein [Shewanella algae]